MFIFVFMNISLLTLNRPADFPKFPSSLRVKYVKETLNLGDGIQGTGVTK